LLSDSCGFVDVERSLTRGRAFVYSCCWPLPAQSLSGPSPVGLAGNPLRLATKPNWLILFRETVSVYCENHTEHTHINI
jgi:hypothetical protein